MKVGDKIQSTITGLNYTITEIHQTDIGNRFKATNSIGQNIYFNEDSIGKSIFK